MITKTLFKEFVMGVCWGFAVWATIPVFDSIYSGDFCISHYANWRSLLFWAAVGGLILPLVIRSKKSSFF